MAVAGVAGAAGAAGAVGAVTPLLPRGSIGAALVVALGSSAYLVIYGALLLMLGVDEVRPAKYRRPPPGRHRGGSASESRPLERVAP